MPGQEVTERMFLNADRSKVVEAGPDAAYLWKIPGDTISEEEQEQFGLTKSRRAAAAERGAPRRGVARAARSDEESAGTDSRDDAASGDAPEGGVKESGQSGADENKEAEQGENKGA